MRYNLNCYSVEIHRIFVFFGSFQVGLNINNTGSMKKSKGYLKWLLSGGGKDSTCSGAKKNKVGEKVYNQSNYYDIDTTITGNSIVNNHYALRF